MRQRVALIHPDLGIGGAEQLMLNLALALQKKGYDVCIYTPRFDPAHCFQELKDGKVRVEVHGNLFPRTICGKLYAFCAYVRMLLCALFIICFRGRFNLVVLDQVPLPIPFLRLFTRAKVLFYCHYPDKLLCVERRSWLKRLYRCVVDFVEEQTIAMAHAIVVNSNFTKGVVHTAFTTIARGRRACCCCCKAPKPTILYPAIERGAFDDRSGREQTMGELVGLDEEQQRLFNAGQKLNIVCTLNRYERKKNLALAIEAFGRYLRDLSAEEKKKNLLIVAGGYDTQVQENVQHFQELQDLAERAHIPKSNIRFMRSISNEARTAFLQNSKLMLYTPANEHFGIVPLEAMYNRCPVIACNSGGPLETVVEGVTGYLLPPDPNAWAAKIAEVLAQPTLIHQLGEAGRKHVSDKFTNDAFADQLHDLVQELLAAPRVRQRE
jgi:alpha-1,3/alpha-1,6-mannosyltransferase